MGPSVLALFIYSTSSSLSPHSLNRIHIVRISTTFLFGYRLSSSFSFAYSPRQSNSDIQSVCTVTRYTSYCIDRSIMAFRSNEMFKKIIKKVKEENLAPGVKESLKKYIPDNKVVMGRAKRGLYAGCHIQFGNQISEDGGNKSRRTWKPNVQEKRLFSYILDRHIRVKVSTHALRCIDKAGGIDEYLLKTPYHKMDTEMGLFWKAKMEKMYAELGETNVAFFSPEDEVKFEQIFKDLKLAEQAARREARRLNYPPSNNQKQIEEGKEEASVAE